MRTSADTSADKLFYFYLAMLIFRYFVYLFSLDNFCAKPKIYVNCEPIDQPSGLYGFTVLIKKLHQLLLKGTIRIDAKQRALTLTLAAALTPALIAALRRGETWEGAKHSDGPVFSVGTCQSLLICNGRQESPIGHRDQQSAFSQRARCEFLLCNNAQ